MSNKFCSGYKREGHDVIIEQFAGDTSRPDGLNKYCQDCQAAKNRAAYERNRETRLQRKRDIKAGVVSAAASKTPAGRKPRVPGAVMREVKITLSEAELKRLEKYGRNDAERVRFAIYALIGE